MCGLPFEQALEALMHADQLLCINKREAKKYLKVLGESFLAWQRLDTGEVILYYDRNKVTQWKVK